MLKYSFALFFLVAMAACGTEAIIGDDENRLVDQSVVMADSTYSDSYDETQSDPFVINAARIVGPDLEIDVSYSGGCKTHGFQLIWPEAILTIYPYQFAFYLSHQAYGDTCEAWVSETLIIELGDNPLGLSYQALQEAQLKIINVNDNANVIEVEN